jgi:hypothetical protein
MTITDNTSLPDCPEVATYRTDVRACKMADLPHKQVAGDQIVCASEGG